MPLVNLMERFGKQYRISFDPAYNPKGVPKAKRDPCMMQIKCKYGTIHAHGGDILTLEIEGHCITRNRIKKLPVILHCHEASDFASLQFHVDDIDSIAEIAKPHRMPRLTSEQREAQRWRMLRVREQFQRKSPEFGPRTHPDKKPDR